MCARANTSDEKAVISGGGASDLAAVKAIADREKPALGFVHRGSLTRAVARDELVVASIETTVVGFCHLYRRRDGIVTVYHVAVAPERRGEGIGRALLTYLGRDASARGMQAIRLKCPADLPANGFYARIGFRLIAKELTSARPLNVWERHIEDP